MKLNNFDPLDHLKTKEDFQLALEAAFEEDPGDGSLIAATLGDIAKARGMIQLAKETGLSLDVLNCSLSGKDNPKFSTIIKVMRALNVHMTVPL